MDDSPPYARPSNYDALIGAMARRAGELGISYADLDRIAGVASGFTGKAFGPSRTKRLGWLSSFDMLGALGLKIALIADDEAAKRSVAKSLKRRANQARPNGYSQAPSGRVLSRVMRHLSIRAKTAREANPAYLANCREWGRMGGLAVAANLTKEQRRERARKAILARWAKREMVKAGVGK